MLRQPRQLLSAGIAILLGVAFVAATLIFSASLNSGMRDTTAGYVGNAKVVMTADSKKAASVIPTELEQKARTVPGITGSRAIVTGALVLEVGDYSNSVSLGSQPALTSHTTLSEGRLAASAAEITVNKPTAAAFHIKVGDEVTLKNFDNGFVQRTVVGIVDLGTEALPKPTTNWVLAPMDQAMDLAGIDGYSMVLLDGNGDATQLKNAIAALPGVSSHNVIVQTDADYISHELEKATSGNDMLRNVLLGFAAIALFVCILVIGNTFSILVAQRVRQLALLRCVGATKSQIFKMVFGEAALLGLVGSILGVLLGAGLAWGLISAAHQGKPGSASFDVTPESIIIPLVLGVTIAVISSIAPARRATRVAPLAAMHPEMAVGKVQRLGKMSALIGLLCIIGGCAMLAWGAFATHAAAEVCIAVAAGGGFISFIGILFLSQGLIPGVARIIGFPLRRTVPGEIALENTQRNPRRSASTANALLVGVTLITVLTVGAFSAQTSISHWLDGKYPQDAIVEAGGNQGVTTTQLNAVRAVKGVQTAALVPQTELSVTTDNGKTSSQTFQGLDDNAASATRIPARYQRMDDKTVRTADTSFTTGQTVTVQGTNGKKIPLTMQVSPDYAINMTISAHTMAELAPQAPANMWIRYTNNSDANTVTADVSRALTHAQNGTESNGATVTSTTQVRDMIQKIIDVVLAVSSGLLAVAVVIAVVGVANTLNLSVLERTQEIGLLRATGMTKKQVRSMITLEAAMLSAVAAVIGIVSGTIFGLAASRALLSSAMFHMGLPWGRLIFILVVATAAGAIAAIAPARRATKVSPAAALVTE